MKVIVPVVYTSLPDEALWKEFKKGEAVAFEEMYRRYAKVLFSYGYKVTSDSALIQDSIQDLFILLWKTREKLSDTTSIKFYLFKALRRRITQQLTSALRESLDLTEDLRGVESVFSHEAYLIEAQTELEKIAALQRAMTTLTKRQREAITLRFYDNFSYQEISEIMSLNYKSVVNLIGKSLSFLKDNIVLFIVWTVSWGMKP